MKVTMIVIFGMLSVALGQIAAAQNSHSADEPPLSYAGVVKYVEMRYPPLAVVANTGGAVVVRAKLDDKGKVTSAAALCGSNLLTGPVVADIMNWVFEPNREKELIMVYHFRIRKDNPCERGQVVSDFTFEPPNLVTIIACGLSAMPHTPTSQ
jgi:hypothetical protein